MYSLGKISHTNSGCFINSFVYILGVSKTVLRILGVRTVGSLPAGLMVQGCCVGPAVPQWWIRCLTRLGLWWCWIPGCNQGTMYIWCQELDMTGLLVGLCFFTFSNSTFSMCR